MVKAKILVAGALSAVLILAGCATDQYGRTRPMTDAEKGVLIGAGVGAAVGLASKDKKNVLIGAVGGGIAGGLVGHYMDKQKQDFERVLRPEIDAGLVSVDALDQDRLRVTMTSGTSFDVDSAQLKPSFYSTLDKIAEVLKRYGKTQLALVGHTDSTGSDAYNQQLSERRAQAVEKYFLSNGVIPERLQAFGRGESQPRASNATPEGRTLNRRVEIIITPIVAQ